MMVATFLFVPCRSGLAALLDVDDLTGAVEGTQGLS
jgi:hypothetical protein